MSALELTRKIESLSKEDFDMIVSLVNRLAEKENHLTYLSEDSLVDELTESIKSSDEGKVMSARQISENMRIKYVL